ncbi:MAG: CheW domain-containing protein [Marinobacter sp.]|nr:CheW domain-containing protein [Marinobacter sp.]
MTTNSRTDLADPTRALVSYLDDLLQTASQSAREPADQPEVPARPARALQEPEATAPTQVVAPARPSVAPAPAPAPAPVAIETTRPVVSDEPPAAISPPDTRPDWSEQPFECLIFKVAGLQLAVPLVLLGAIHRIEGNIKPIPGRPPWYLGMLPDRNQNLRIVDTAEWIMAGRVPANARDGYRFVIRLDNSEWALACDDVAQSFTLDPDEVRWRSARSKRPWLAGTVVQHMCALIDVGTMAAMLARAEKEHTLTLE